MTPWKKTNIITSIGMAIIALLLVLALGATVTGCAANQTQSEVIEGKPSMFVRVESGDHWTVVYHEDTKVMYAVSTCTNNYGTFTLLVNPDGSPMLWGEG